MKRKPLISLLVVAAAAFIWAVGPSVSLSFLLRSPIVLLRELMSLMWPTTLDSTAPRASIFTLRRPQLLLESAAMSPVGTGVAPRSTTGSTSVVSAPSVLTAPSVLNPPTQQIVQDTQLPPIDQVLPSGTMPDLLPTITAPSVPSVPSVSVPDTPSVPGVTVPDVPSVPSVSTPSVPSTPSVSVPSTPTPSTPSVGTPSVGGGTSAGGGGGPVGGGGLLKLP